MTTGGDGAVAVPGRVAAVAGAVCVAVHLATATAGGHGGTVERVVVVGMAAACLPGVRMLWRRPGRAVWRRTALMYGGMVFVHLLVLSAAGAAAHPGHASGDTAGGWAAAGTAAGLTLAGLQVVLAGTVLAVGPNRTVWPGRS